MNYKPTPVPHNGLTLPQKLVVILGLSLIVFSVACRATGETWQRVQNTGVLRVGLDPTYPPFENADGNDLHGFDVDLARALAEDLGIQVEFVYFGYDGLYDALATHQVDVLISALVIQPERTKDFAYSDPYFDAGQRLVLPAGSPIQSVDDLAGHSVAVELGAESHVIATELARRLPDLRIMPFNSPGDALSATAAGEASAAIIDNVSALTRTQRDLQVGDEPVTVEPYALVVRIEDERLLQELNQSLSRLEETGRLQSLFTTWFSHE